MRVFLDHAATTPLCDATRKAEHKWLDCGNPSSLYEEGRQARAAIDEARESLASKLDADFGEIIFTGSGTEAASLAIIGTAVKAQEGKRRTVVFSSAEHHCTLNTTPFLQALGYQVLLAPVDRQARIDKEWLASTLKKEHVLLVAAMHVNNELGTIDNALDIGEICDAHGTLYFSDCVQSFGKLPFSVGSLNADLISISAHKVYGPKGIGALYVKAGTPIKPFVTGGGQERELRAGTENVAAIAGFGEAVRDIDCQDGIKCLKDRLIKGLLPLGAVPTLAADTPQLPNHLHLRFPGTPAEAVLIGMDREGVSIGSGAACSSGSLEPSHVLSACGYSPEESQEGIRLTLGTGNNEDQIDFSVAKFQKVVARIRHRSTLGT